MFGWFRKKPPPQNVTEQVAQSPTRFNPGWQFTYERKPGPTPGAQNYAYENLGLVEFSPIGAGSVNRTQLRVLQPAPMYLHFATWLQGLGGVAQGTIYGQPLISPQATEDQING